MNNGQSKDYILLTGVIIMVKQIIVSKNVFRASDEISLKDEFTKKWVEIINQTEKNKNCTTIHT